MNYCYPASSMSASARQSLLGGKVAYRRHLTCTTRRKCFDKRPQRLGIIISAESKGPSFFDRVERDELQHYLQKAPISILVLLGPSNCGRTALLQEVLCKNASGFDFPPCYIDARSRQLSEESVLVNSLQEGGATAVEKLSGLLKNFDSSHIGKVFRALSFQQTVDAHTLYIGRERVVAAFLRRQPQSMDNIMEVYGQMLKMYKSGRSPSGGWPVICIDEANVLMEWRHGSLEKRQTLRALLNYFVWASRQENMCHVILATSDYGFYDWLTDEIDVTYIRPEVIGNFPEEEARQFFTKQAPFMAGQDIELSEDDWTKVWEVCGGNAGQLMMAASAYSGDWDAALEVVWKLLMRHVRSGYSDSRNNWTQQQFTTVVRLLLASEHAAVTMRTLRRTLGDEARDVIDAMVKARLLSYRPWSSWARDVPREVRGPLGGTLVTAYSPGHLYCMARLEESGRFVSTDKFAKKSLLAMGSKTLRL